MARGRMIVKDVATDARLWEQLSKEARNAFLWVIPHIETNGTTPRDPRAIRLSCFPCDKDIRDADMESIVQEWLHTTPPLATDEKSPSGTSRLMFADFEMANENLDFFRKRRERENVRTKRTVLDSPRQSIERKKERKKEVKEINKEKITDIAPSASANADREPTPIQRVVNAYKEAKGVGMEDKAWDRANFARYSKAAKSLIECLGGWQQAAVYVIGKGQEFEDKGIEWTLETITRHAWDNRGKLNARPQEQIGDSGVLERGRRKEIARSGNKISSAGQILGAGAFQSPRRNDPEISDAPFLEHEDDPSGRGGSDE